MASLVDKAREALERRRENAEHKLLELAEREHNPRDGDAEAAAELMQVLNIRLENLERAFELARSVRRYEGLVGELPTAIQAECDVKARIRQIETKAYEAKQEIDRQCIAEVKQVRVRNANIFARISECRNADARLPGLRQELRHMLGTR